MKHFERTDNGGMRLSPAAWKIIYDVMVHTEYAINGGIKCPPLGREEEILKLRQMFIEEGYNIEELT